MGDPAGVARARRRDDLPGARPGRGPDASPRASSSATSRAARPLLDRDADARASRPRCSSGSTTATSRRARRSRALRPAAQQIVSIARALSRDVRLLIMDEPSAILDDGEIETLFERRAPAHGRRRRRRSTSRTASTRSAASATASRCSPTGAPSPPASRPTTPHRRAGGADGRPQGRAALPRARRRARDEVVLDVRDVRRLPDGARRAASRCARARCSGIGGLVGAGRTELLRLIYGLDRPDDGRGLARRQAAAAGRPDARDRRGARARARGPQVPGPAARTGAWPRTSASPTSAASPAAG